jgi:hypothetical protein
VRYLALLGLVFAAAAAGTATAVSNAERGAGASAATSAHAAREPAPVASLEPAETTKLWRELVARRSRRAEVAADCRPLRAVFYAATDFLRLAAKLAATASPCAEYYISIPPLVSDKTLPRPNAAWRIRALGPNFHAMAEFHFSTWTRWVASTGSSWHAAGVEARKRMTAAGYDFSNGDTWVLNEVSSAVRRGVGNARANVRELLRGLYEGDGTRPTRGAVFVIGVGQRASDVSLYQTNLQNWLADSDFWADMATYVSDWSQEVYGDVRSHAVPGVPTSVRRDYLNDYLQHKLVLAGAGPPEIETARSFLRATFSPLANAAWERETAYGWTMVPAEQMGGYVSAQVHALRYFSATSGQPQDHWGFAWAPRNAAGIAPAEFAARTGLVLDRLAAAARDSADTPDPTDPGSAACGPPGQNVWCVGDVEGARLTEAWKSFRGWTQSVLSFSTPAQTIPAGTPSAAMGLALVTSSGLPVTTPTPLAVTLSSSSPQGTFATSPAGPWSSTLSLAIAAGTGTSGAFYYQDTQAGSPVLTASAAGATSGTQTVTVSPGPVAALTITPASAMVRARASQRFSAAGADAYGNPVQVAAAWSLIPPALGTIAPKTGAATTFTGGRTLGSGSMTATAATETATISASASLTVTPARLRIVSIGYRNRKNVVFISASAVDASGRPVSRAIVSLLVRRNGRRHFSGRAITGAAGRTVYRVPARRGGCFTTTIRRASAAGFAWDGRSPRNRFCQKGGK